MNGIITLCTDFADQDSFVGSMKGVILAIYPSATIIDITHQIPRHQIKSGAYILSTYYHLFPEGTIHVCIVDPGVGSSRKPIVVETNRYAFVAPDNGVLSYVYQRCRSWQAFAIDNKQWMREDVSQTFHGRDIFAPVAAHLASGESTQKAGPKLTNPIRFDIAGPIISEHYVEGVVIHVDTFGNIITNIPNSALMKKTFRLLAGQYTITRLSRTYQDGSPDILVALPGSMGTIELAVNQGNATRLTGLTIDDTIRCELIN